MFIFLFLSGKEKQIFSKWHVSLHLIGLALKLPAQGYRFPTKDVLFAPFSILQAICCLPSGQERRSWICRSSVSAISVGVAYGECHRFQNDWTIEYIIWPCDRRFAGISRRFSSGAKTKFLSIKKLEGIKGLRYLGSLLKRDSVREFKIASIWHRDVNVSIVRNVSPIIFSNCFYGFNLSFPNAAKIGRTGVK